MSVTTNVRRVDPSVLVALASYAGEVTRCKTRAMSHTLSSSDRLRRGAPNAGAWLTERSAARRQRRAARRAAIEAKAAALADALG